MDLTNQLINPETNKRCGGESEKKFVEEMKTFNNLILYLRLNSSFENKSLEKLSIVGNFPFTTGGSKELITGHIF